MHSPQLGLPAVCRLLVLWLLHSPSRTSSTNGDERDHSDPVIAFEGQCSMQSMHSPHKQCSMGTSGLSCASVNTVASDRRGP